MNNSCHSQNLEQAGQLEELIPKNRHVQAKDRTRLESCQPRVNSCSLTLVLNSLNGGFSQSIGISLLCGKKCVILAKKAKHGVHLADRARPKCPCSHPLLRKPLKKLCEVKKSRLKFLKGNCLSFYKALVEKIKTLTCSVCS